MLNPFTGEPLDDAAIARLRVRTGGVTGLVGSYGWTRRRANGRPKEHKGVDYLCSYGVPVFALHDGVIRLDGFQRNSKGEERNEGFGSRILLASEDELTRSLYAHLERQVYSKDMKITEGSLIGYTGRTGNTAGSPDHLHLELWLDGRRVNPHFVLTGEGSLDGVPKPEATS